MDYRPNHRQHEARAALRRMATATASQAAIVIAEGPDLSRQERAAYERLIEAAKECQQIVDTQEAGR